MYFLDFGRTQIDRVMGWRGVPKKLRRLKMTFNMILQHSIDMLACQIIPNCGLTMGAVLEIAEAEL
jgi:hypothetical protein